MKKYIRLFLIFLAAGIHGSCESYLETESPSIFTEESAFSNLDFATKVVMGVYSNLASQNIYGYEIGMFYPSDNDIEFVSGTDDGGRRSLSRYNTSEGNTYVVGPWRTLYETIERANICIDQLPKSPIWEGEFTTEAHRLYGEAKTLRALCYFELIRNWGDVPFSVKSVQDGDNYYLPRTDRDEIYESLIADLLEAEQYVPWMKEINTVERVGKGFVKGLRARMALAYAGYSVRLDNQGTRRGRNWEAYYQIAHQECEELMESGQHALNPDYVQFFKGVHAYQQDLIYGESLFEIAFGRLYSGRVGESIGMAFSTNPADPKYGRAAAAINTSPYYYYSFDTKDIRRNVSCELYGYNGGAAYPSIQRLVNESSYKVSKWRRSWINPTLGDGNKETAYTGVNWPIMRYTDIILMFAETENELNGPTTAAKEALASVRKRAFPPELWDTKVTGYVDSVSTGKESFFNALVNERAWEFGGEMIRKYDLIRWNLLGEKLEEAKAENMKIINNDPKWQNVPNYLFWRADGEFIDILNPDYRLPSTNIATYTRTSWLSGISNKTTFTTTINNIANGYDKTKNNHLFAIGAAILTESNGALSNEGLPK